MPKVVYDPKADMLRIVYQPWTDDTRPVATDEIVLMMEGDVIVGAVYPNYLAALLREFDMKIPASHNVREQMVADSLQEAAWH